MRVFLNKNFIASLLPFHEKALSIDDCLYHNISNAYFLLKICVALFASFLLAILNFMISGASRRAVEKIRQNGGLIQDGKTFLPILMGLIFLCIALRGNPYSKQIYAYDIIGKMNEDAYCFVVLITCVLFEIYLITVVLYKCGFRSSK